MGGSSGTGLDGVDAEAGYFSEFLSAQISRHPIFTNMKFWQHVLKEAVQAKTEKVRGFWRVWSFVLFIGEGVWGVVVLVIFVYYCIV